MFLKLAVVLLGFLCLVHARSSWNSKYEHQNLEEELIRELLEQQEFRHLGDGPECCKDKSCNDDDKKKCPHKKGDRRPKCCKDDSCKGDEKCPSEEEDKPPKCCPEDCEDCPSDERDESSKCCPEDCVISGECIPEEVDLPECCKPDDEDRPKCRPKCCGSAGNGIPECCPEACGANIVCKPPCCKDKYCDQSVLPDCPSDIKREKGDRPPKCCKDDSCNDDDKKKCPHKKADLPECCKPDDEDRPKCRPKCCGSAATEQCPSDVICPPPKQKEPDSKRLLRYLEKLLEEDERK